MRAALLVVAIGGILLTVAAAYRLRALARAPLEVAVVLLGMAGAAILLRKWSARLTRSGYHVLLLGGLFAITRLFVLAIVPTEPVSDFDSYFRLAALLARGQPMPPTDEVEFFNAWGYPLLLAPWFAAFGPSLVLAKLLNVAAGTLACCLLYRLTGQLISSKVAVVTTLLFTLWPGQLLLTPVLASEHFALVLCLGYLLLLARASRRRGFAAFELALAGALLAASTAVRPATGAALACALVLLCTPRRPRRRRVAQLALVAAASLATWCAYLGLLRSVYKATPSSVGWYNLMVGLNIETRGQYSPADSEAYFTHPTPVEQDRFARATAYRRASENLTRLPWLFRRKTLLLWGTDDDAVKWSTASMAAGVTSVWVRGHVNGLYASSQYFHLAVLALGALGAVRAVRGRFKPLLFIPAALLLAGTALHAVFETQPRYHYVFETGLLVFAGAGLRQQPRHVPACAGESTKVRPAGTVMPERESAVRPDRPGVLPGSNRPQGMVRSACRPAGPPG